MKVSNEYVVAKGRTIHHKGCPNFGPGKIFPAADLGLDEKSFNSLIRDGALVLRKEISPPEESKEPKVKEKGDELEDKTKAELQEFAEDLGIQYSSRASKDELIGLIREVMG